MRQESPYTDQIIDLLDCPFCGAHPEVKHIGNAYTKSRKITIRCPSCRVERTDATIRFDFVWLERVAEEHWNQRGQAGRATLRTLIQAAKSMPEHPYTPAQNALDDAVEAAEKVVGEVAG